MRASTFLASPFVPVFYVLLERTSGRLRKGKSPEPPASEEEPDTTRP